MAKIKLKMNSGEVYFTHTNKYETLEEVVNKIVKNNGYISGETLTKKKTWINIKYIESIALEAEDER